MQTSSEDRRGLELRVGAAIGALVSAARAVTEESAAAFHPDLQPAAFHIAQWLRSFGPARPSTIAAAVRMDRSSTSTLLGQMDALGLLLRRDDPADRRAQLVELSPVGTARLDAVGEEKGAVFSERMRGCSDAELRQLVALMGKITSA
jgi:DNA-binding MarR family transcriptional regulator